MLSKIARTRGLGVTKICTVLLFWSFIVRDEPEWIQAKMILGWIIEVGLMGETF